MRVDVQSYPYDRQVISKRRIPGWLLPAILTGLLGAGLLGACETAPPVQEMSDARQAIEVAVQAGARSRAEPELNEALQYLEEAERELDVENYARARRSALQAKSKALEARALSEAAGPP